MNINVPKFFIWKKKKISIITIQNEWEYIGLFCAEKDLQKGEFIKYATNRSKRTIGKHQIKAAKTPKYHQIRLQTLTQ